MKTYTAADLPNIEILAAAKDMELKFWIAAMTEKTQSSKSATIEIVNATPPETPLDGPAAFTWQRIGPNIVGEKENNIKNFGITISKITYRDFVLVLNKNGANKFVQFTVEQWWEITTQEDLAQAVHAATDINDFHIPLENNSNLNMVLATIYQGEYYIMNLSALNVEIDESTGTISTITGQYKGSTLIQ
jgi:hypothetical protein